MIDWNKECVTVRGFRDRNGEHIPDCPRQRTDSLLKALLFLVQEISGTGGRLIQAKQRDGVVEFVAFHDFMGCRDTTFFSASAADMQPILDFFDFLARHSSVDPDGGFDSYVELSTKLSSRSALLMNVLIFLGIPDTDREIVCDYVDRDDFAYCLGCWLLDPSTSLSELLGVEVKAA